MATKTQAPPAYIQFRNASAYSLVTEMVEWWPDAEIPGMGTVYLTTREHPADMWPPSEQIGSICSLSTARWFAYAHGCQVEEPQQQATMETVIAEVAAAIEENCATWERGESCSPSDLDHVLAADRILARRRTDYPGSTPDGREFVADVMWQEANEKGYGPEEYAAHVVAILMEQ